MASIGFALAIYRGGQFDLKDPWVHALGLTPLPLFMAGVLVLALAKSPPSPSLSQMPYVLRTLLTI